jgi:hypothetical protein
MPNNVNPTRNTSTLPRYSPREKVIQEITAYRLNHPYGLCRSPFAPKNPCYIPATEAMLGDPSNLQIHIAEY